MTSEWELTFPDLEQLDTSKRNEYRKQIYLDPSASPDFSSINEMLLLFLAGWQQDVETARLKREEKNTLQQRQLSELRKREEQVAVEKQFHQLEKERIEAKKEEERRNLATKIAAEDARIRQQINDRVTQAKSQMWQWKEGMRITLYLWRWCEGGAIHDDGTLELSWGVLWSDRDCIDRDGYIHGWSDRHCYLEDGKYRNLLVRERNLKLVPEIHKPVVEKHVYQNLEELPLALRIPKFCSVVGIELYGAYDWQTIELIAQMQSQSTDEDMMWYRHNSDASEVCFLGEEPLDWVKDLLK